MSTSRLWLGPGAGASCVGVSSPTDNRHCAWAGCAKERTVEAMGLGKENKQVPSPVPTPCRTTRWRALGTRCTICVKCQDVRDRPWLRVRSGLVVRQVWFSQLAAGLAPVLGPTMSCVRPTRLPVSTDEALCCLVWYVLYAGSTDQNPGKKTAPFVLCWLHASRSSSRHDHDNHVLTPNRLLGHLLVRFHRSFSPPAHAPLLPPPALLRPCTAVLPTPPTFLHDLI